jgi:hypothetical protein
VDTATRISLPEGYERLCDLNRLWAFLPTGVDLPLTCAPADATAYPKFVVGPRDLISAASRYDENCHLHYMCYARRNQGETIAAVSLLEYLLSEYGGRLLPDIIRAFEKRDTWAELIRELPGLQETAVRAGWCSYLAREYGVSDCPVFDH